MEKRGIDPRTLRPFKPYKRFGTNATHRVVRHGNSSPCIPGEILTDGNRYVVLNEGRRWSGENARYVYLRKLTKDIPVTDNKRQATSFQEGERFVFGGVTFEVLEEYPGAHEDCGPYMIVKHAEGLEPPRVWSSYMLNRRVTPVHKAEPGYYDYRGRVIHVLGDSYDFYHEYDGSGQVRTRHKIPPANALVRLRPVEDRRALETFDPGDHTSRGYVVGRCKDNYYVIVQKQKGHPVRYEPDRLATLEYPKGEAPAGSWYFHDGELYYAGEHYRFVRTVTAVRWEADDDE